MCEPKKLINLNILRVPFTQDGGKLKIFEKFKAIRKTLESPLLPKIVL